VPNPPKNTDLDNIIIIIISLFVQQSTISDTIYTI